MEEKIIFKVAETEEEVEFYIIEETRINNTDYLLVTDEEGDEDGEAYILKDVSKSENEDALYEIVEDQNELDYLAKIFSEIVDDIEIES